MNSKTGKFVSLVLLSLLLGTTAQGKDDNQEIVLEKMVKPIVNTSNSKYLEINSRGSIDVALLVDEQGRVDDWIPIRTNDMYFIKALGRVIDQWRFRPVMKDGEAVWSYFQVKIEFDSSGSVVDLDVGDAVLAFYNTMRDDFQLVVPFSELDAIPEPIDINIPKVHSNLVDADSGGTVKLQFFIDQEGNVRLPVVREADTDTVVTGIILESFLDWKFKPPMQNGKPVITRAVIPFKVE